MSYHDAERILAKVSVGQTAFRRFKVETLRKLCASLDLPMSCKKPSSKAAKGECIKALFSFVSLNLHLLDIGLNSDGWVEGDGGMEDICCKRSGWFQEAGETKPEPHVKPNRDVRD